MSESATTIAAGAPASPAAPSTLFGGADSGSGTAPAAPAAPPPPAAQAPATTPAPGAPVEPWSTWSAEKKGFFENKGWLKDGKLNVDQMAEGYIHVEKLRGVPGEEVFRLSKNPTPDEIARLDERRGVPKDPTGYGLKPGDGEDPALLDAVAKGAHEARLSPDQLKAVLGLNKTLFEQQETARAAAEARRFAEDGAKLSQEWGNAAPQNKAIARRAANLDAFKSEGLDEGFWEYAGKYPGAGPASIARALHKLGLGLGEDKFVTGDPTSGGVRTPESAQARIDEISANPTLRKSILEGTAPKALLDEWNALSASLLAGQRR